MKAVSKLLKNELSVNEQHEQTSPALSDSSSHRLLQRLSPADYQAAQAVQLAKPLPDVENADRMAVLVFRLCQEWFALPAQICRQVIAPISAHTLPHRSNSTLIGVVNVSGQMLLKVSLLDLLVAGSTDEEPIEPTSSGDSRSGLTALTHRRQIYPRMVVVENANAEGSVEVWTFDVDELEGICSLETDCLELPAAGRQKRGTYTHRVFRWKGNSVSLLDDGRLFDALRQRAL